jgi:hypothetical protein
MDVQPDAPEDDLLSLALLLQEKWVRSHGLNSLVTRDDFDDARFDEVIASLWEKRGAWEEQHTASLNDEETTPPALVSVNTSTCMFQ